MVRNANERPVAPVSSPAMNQVSDSWSACKPSATGKSSALSLCSSRNGYLRQSVFMSRLGCLDRVVLVGAQELPHLLDVVVSTQLERFGRQSVVHDRNRRLSKVLRERPLGGLQCAGRLSRQPGSQLQRLLHQRLGGGDPIGQTQVHCQRRRDALRSEERRVG